MRPLSARNPRVLQLSRLVRRSEERATERAFVVEGPTLVRLAVESGAEVRAVFVDGAAVDRAVIAALLDAVPPAVDRWLLPPGTLDRVGDAATSQGVLATVSVQDPPLPTPARTNLVLVLAELADPGNVGTLIRAGVAAGAGTVVLAGGVDPTSPKVVRASAGAVFTTDIVRVANPHEIVDWLASSGFRTVGTVVDGGEAYDSTDLTGPVAVVLGNEARGLSDELCGLVDELVTIPMVGSTESLNVAMAGTVILFEVLRQRRAGRLSFGVDAAGPEAQQFPTP